MIVLYEYPKIQLRVPVPCLPTLSNQLLSICGWTVGVFGLLTVAMIRRLIIFQIRTYDRSIPSLFMSMISEETRQSSV